MWSFNVVTFVHGFWLFHVHSRWSARPVNSDVMRHEGSSTTITFACPSCGSRYAVADDYAGKKASCKNCDSQFIVPTATPMPKPPPPATQNRNVVPEVSAAPGRPAKQSLSTNAKFAIASLVSGIIALAYPACITGPIGSIAAIIIGVLGIKSEKRGFAIAGIVLACIALAILVLLTYLEYHNRKMINDILQDL